jgi:hypothetical protein
MNSADGIADGKLCMLSPSGQILSIVVDDSEISSSERNTQSSFDEGTSRGL